MKNVIKASRKLFVARSSILFKLNLVIMLIVSVTLILTGSILAIHEWTVFRDLGTRSVTTLAEVVGRNSTAALAFGDQKVASEILSALESEPEIILGCLYTDQDELFATYSLNGNQDLFCPKRSPVSGPHFFRERLGFSLAVTQDNEKYGTLYLLSNMSHFRNRLRLYGLLLITVILSASVFAFFIAARLRHIVVGPILKLAETARFISEQGKYNLRAEKTTEIETNSLVTAFNGMLDVIQEREESIRQSEELFRASFDLAAVGEVMVGAYGKFIRVNSALCKMLGYTSNELLGMSFVNVTHPEDQTKSMQSFEGLFGGGVLNSVFEKRYRKKDGSDLWAIVSSAPIRNSSGSVIMLISVIQDITQRKLAERERDQLLIREREARIEAEKSIQMRDDFLSIASHELRTPITPMKMQMQMMKSQLQLMPPGAIPHGTSLLKTFEISERQLDNLEKLTEDLLNVSRISAGRLSLRLQIEDLAEIVQNAIEQLQPEFKRAGYQVELKFDSGVHCLVDRIRIEEIVTNLLTNAMKYGEKKPIQVQVVKEDGKGKIRIKDLGIGIAKEDQEKIFQRFERVASLKHFPGLGLGLYITKELVVAQGGSISVASELGKGSVFTVEFTLV